MNSKCLSAFSENRKSEGNLFMVFSLFCLYLLSSVTAFSQAENQHTNTSETQLEPFLLLEKPATKKRIRYYIGDEIEFKLKNDKGFVKGTIVQFSDTSFYVNNFVEVPLSSVDALADRSKGSAVKGIALSALGAIPMFFVFSAANNIFNTGDRPIIDKEVYPVTAVFLGIGTLGLSYKGKRYRLKNKWRIIMVRL